MANGGKQWQLDLVSLAHLKDYYDLSGSLFEQLPCDQPLEFLHARHKIDVTQFGLTGLFENIR